MYIEQIYTGCLSEAAYYIESEGEAVVIDPLRDTTPYIQKAQERGAQINYVLETHFHADFVSGHLDLATRTKATIVFGPNAQTSFDAHIAKDGEVLKVGKITLEVLHTPGHTLESSCYLLRDEQGDSHALFTGDTLFIGDVGRPDLAVKNELTETDLAEMLYDSLRNKIMPLPNEVIIYPAHGAGSACGKNISSETYATLGDQKKNNYALREISKEKFVHEVTKGIPPAPKYFAENARLNKQGYEQLDEVMLNSLRRLNTDEVQMLVKSGAIVLDCRTPMEFAQGHIPGAVFIGLDGQFAVWAATLIKDLNQPLVLVAPTKRHHEAVLRLARVGFDQVQGYLSKGMRGWTGETATIEQLDARFMEKMPKIGKVIDVRKPGEYEAGHLAEAKLSPLDYLPEHLADFDPSEIYFIHCKSGYRSMVACSLLKKAGVDDVYNITGGFDALKKTRVDIISETTTQSQAL